MMHVHILPILKDNYTFVLEGQNGDVGVVDAGEAAPVIAFLDARALTPQVIFSTHHHGDHIAGNAALIARYGCALAPPDCAAFGGERLTILKTPGHTLDHVCFYFPESGILFTGDTLFSMGCGRLFEGTAVQMWESLQKISALPNDTRIYCAHEYTASNGAFGLSVEPDNTDIQARMVEVKALRAQNLPTIPVTLAMEKKTNVFLRAGSAEKFTALRAMKDVF